MITQKFNFKVPPGKRYFKLQNTIPARVNWDKICVLIKACTDIRKAMCYGCGGGTLYDNNGNKYPVSKNNSVDEVKNIIEEIRKTNGTI